MGIVWKTSMFDDNCSVVFPYLSTNNRATCIRFNQRDYGGLTPIPTTTRLPDLEDQEDSKSRLEIIFESVVRQNCENVSETSLRFCKPFEVVSHDKKRGAQRKTLVQIPWEKLEGKVCANYNDSDNGSRKGSGSRSAMSVL